MPSSLEANIGISVKLELNFKNIDIILKLLSSQSKLIIYGLSEKLFVIVNFVMMKINHHILIIEFYKNCLD
jgi:hypothetical protein